MFLVTKRQILIINNFKVEVFVLQKMETTQLIMKRLKRVTLLVTVSLFTAFILVAGRSKDSKSESKIDETTCDTKEKETTLILYPNLPTPSNRQTNWACSSYAKSVDWKSKC